MGPDSNKTKKLFHNSSSNWSSNYLSLTIIIFSLSMLALTIVINPSVYGQSENIKTENIRAVNSFGEAFDKINPNQIVQISTDITNVKEFEQDFIYKVLVLNKGGKTVQPEKWITGKIMSNQTLTVGLSWIPESGGDFKALISVGNNLDNANLVGEVSLQVKSNQTMDEHYCNDGFELVFKISDNSPLCVKPTTAEKLIERGLVYRS